MKKITLSLVLLISFVFSSSNASAGIGTCALVGGVGGFSVGALKGGLDAFARAYDDASKLNNPSVVFIALATETMLLAPVMSLATGFNYALYGAVTGAVACAGKQYLLQR